MVKIENTIPNDKHVEHRNSHSLQMQIGTATLEESDSFFKKLKISLTV